MESDARDGVIRKLERALEDQKHVNDVLSRQIDDLMFYQRLGDIAAIEIVAFTGPPPRNNPNPTAQGAGNPLVLRAYVFTPRDLDRDGKHPLIVQVHGGIHANFGSGATSAAVSITTVGAAATALSGSLTASNASLKFVAV